MDAVGMRLSSKMCPSSHVRIAAQVYRGKCEVCEEFGCVMDILARIRRLAPRRRFIFTKKVDKKLESFSLTRDLVLEAIYNAPTIYKTVRSKNPRKGTVETQYVLKGRTFDGQFIEAKVRFDALRKTGLIEKARRLIPPPTGWKCPTCGEKALIRVKKSFRFEKGLRCKYNSQKK
jgi:hypothetical protein